MVELKILKMTIIINNRHCEICEGKSLTNLALGHVLAFLPSRDSEDWEANTGQNIKRVTREGAGVTLEALCDGGMK